MTAELIGATLIIVCLLILLATGLEVFAALGIAATIGVLFLIGKLAWLGQFPSTAFESINSFVLTAVPLFIFMGSMFANTGVVRNLFGALEKLFGNFPGGTVSSVVAANGLFGALCGSTFAATATFGKTSFPEMERLGYDPRLSLGSIAIAGLLSAAIPPSCTLIVYGSYSDTSVSRLFAATLIPGVLLTLLIMATVVVWVILKPKAVPKLPGYSFREKMVSIRDLLPWLGLIALVLGVIFAGIMTPTESASLGAIGSVVLAVAYRRMSLTALKESLWTAMKITSMMALLIVAAKLLGQVLLNIGVTNALPGLVLGLPFGKYGVLAIIAIFYLIGGMFIADWPLMLLTLSIVLPIILELGYSQVWFGVWFILVGEVGVITPPFGMHLFILNTIAPKYDPWMIGRSALPFLIPVFMVAILMAIFPQLALWLPGVLYQ